MFPEYACNDHFPLNPRSQENLKRRSEVIVIFSLFLRVIVFFIDHHSHAGEGKARQAPLKDDQHQAIALQTHTLQPNDAIAHPQAGTSA